MRAPTNPSSPRRRGAVRGAAAVAVLGLLAATPPTPAAAQTGGTYEIRRGDTLLGLARRFDTTVRDLVAANGVRDRHRIIAGATLRIPGSTAGGSTTARLASTSSSRQQPGVRHQVRRGETLQGIARRHGIRAADLARWNGIVGDRVYAGTRLVLFDPGSLPAAGSGGGGTHVVARGETLGGIARRYGTTTSELAAANGVGDPHRIVAGARLTVPGGAGVRCPVPGARFVNDWGYPRAGGSGHNGTDLFAPRGTPVVAPVDGVVRTGTGRIGGNQFWLTDASGRTWFGSHLDRFGATGRVRAGDVVGYVGTTGNAEGTRPHLHFEHRPAGTPVNPYPLLREIC